MCAYISIKSKHEQMLKHFTKNNITLSICIKNYKRLKGNF